VKIALNFRQHFPRKHDEPPLEKSARPYYYTYV
jgi:hypothetical protein